MPTIKFFQLNYNQIPKLFNLPKETYLSNTARLIPEEVLEQTIEQSLELDEVMMQLDKDLDRTAYVDFNGRKASELKSDWLTHSLYTTALSKGVFPSYTQGNATAGCIGEIIFTWHFALPLSKTDHQSFSQLVPQIKKICFAYKNAKGEPCGFSLITAPTGINAPNGAEPKKHQGWIISVIQNTTGKPKNRRITVLGTQNYIDTKPHSAMDEKNLDELKAKLKTAINNDKIFDLISGIFNENSSLNETYIEELTLRIKSSKNIDNRDKKREQLNCLFELSELYTLQLTPFISQIKKQISEDIHFFKDANYKIHLEEVLNKIALELNKKEDNPKSVQEIEAILKNISQRLADLEELAEKAYRQIEWVHTYKALIQKIKNEAATINFDGTLQDEKKIQFLTQFDVSQVQTKIEDFYHKHPDVQEYNRKKKEFCQENNQKLVQQVNPKNTFFPSNNFILKVGLLFGLVAGITVGIGVTLTGLFAPLTVGLIAAAATLLASEVLSIGLRSFFNEEKHRKKIKTYEDKLSEIRTEQEQTLRTNEEEFQQKIDLDSFLQPELPEFLSHIVQNTPLTPLTPHAVAHALKTSCSDQEAISLAKSCFSLWAMKQENLGFGVPEVESVLSQPPI